MRGMPAARNQPGRSRYRARNPGPIGQVRPEYFAFIGGDYDIMVGRSLREDGDLALDQNIAAVGLARSASVFEDAFLHDRGTETLGGALERIRPHPVILVRARDQEPVAPLFPNQ